MKILVTGANGYLGQGIVRSILNNGHCVVATDFNTQFVDERAERIACNLFEVDNPYSFFGEPDVISIWHGETGLFTIPVRILMIFLSTMRLLKKWLMEVFNRLLLWEACTKLASLRVA